MHTNDVNTYDAKPDHESMIKNAKSTAIEALVNEMLSAIHSLAYEDSTSNFGTALPRVVQLLASYCAYVSFENSQIYWTVLANLPTIIHNTLESQKVKNDELADQVVVEAGYRISKSKAKRIAVQKRK